MKIEEINCLIDAYQDGDIEKSDAIKLADVIRSGGSQSDWIMRELEIRGLIAHVFDETSPSRFVSSLMARFRAEPESEKFEQDFKNRLGEAQRSRPTHHHEEIKRAINTVGSATEADARRPSQQRSIKIWLWVILCAVIAVLVYLLSFLLNREVARLNESSRGLHVFRGNSEVVSEKNMALFAGDRLSLLGQGEVKFILQNQSQVMMLNESSLVLELKGDVLKRSAFQNLTSLFVEKGYIKTDLNGTKTPLVIWTPHAVLKMMEGQCEIRSSELSTMIKLIRGKAILSTLLGNKTRNLEGNLTFLVNDAGQIEEHRLNGESTNGK